MRKITESKITDTVAFLCVKANLKIRPDVLSALVKASENEKNLKARTILNQLVENAKIAAKDRVPICQDTDLPVVFVEVGKDINISGLDMDKAINKGIEKGYRQGNLRNSVIKDPLERGRSGFIPAVIHYEFGNHHGLRLTVLPKGFGSENKTKLFMFLPTASMEEIKDFIVSSEAIGK
ncbi:MAG TPA: fumarate hydratase, partial [Candidatus Omnitrophota bacterium]|nr:fumarate hydratase [Candidatus Omnitrophota bacterium]